MKNALFLLVLLLGLAACAPAQQPPSATPTPPPTDTPMPTETWTPTAFPTPKPSPTPSVDYTPYLEMPKTLKEFKTANSREDAFALMDYLASHPELSHLTPGSEAPFISKLMTNPSTGEGHLAINCNGQGTVNCAPEAFMQFPEQGIDVHVIIWAIRNKDNSIGLFARYHYDSYQLNFGTQGYQQLVADRLGYRDVMIHTGVPTNHQDDLPYTMFLYQQPGFMDAVQKLIDTGIIPEEFRTMILPW